MDECVRVHARVWACSGMSVSVFMHECECSCTSVCSFRSVCSCMSVSVHARVCAPSGVCVHARVWVFMHECVLLQECVFMHECVSAFTLVADRWAFVVPAAQHSTAAHVTRRAVPRTTLQTHTHYQWYTIPQVCVTECCKWMWGVNEMLLCVECEDGMCVCMCVREWVGELD